VANDDIVLLEALILALPLLGIPALIIAQLVVDTPILRRDLPVTDRRRTAATVLAIISLIVAAPLTLMVWALGFLGALLLSGLAVPAILTLVRLRQHPAGPRGMEHPRGA